MADINIERRSRARWPWIVGAILLLLLLWFAADLIRSRAVGTTDDTAGSRFSIIDAGTAVQRRL